MSRRLKIYDNVTTFKLVGKTNKDSVTVVSITFTCDVCSG